MENNSVTNVSQRRTRVADKNKSGREKKQKIEKILKHKSCRKHTHIQTQSKEIKKKKQKQKYILSDLQEEEDKVKQKRKL